MAVYHKWADLYWPTSLTEAMIAAGIDASAARDMPTEDAPDRLRQ